MTVQSALERTSDWGGSEPAGAGAGHGLENPRRAAAGGAGGASADGADAVGASVKAAVGVAGDASGGGARVVAALEGIGALLDVLVGVEAVGLPGRVLHEAVRQLEVMDRRLAGLRAGLYTAVEAEGLWALEGARSFPAWVRTQTQASPAKAGAITRTARALRDHLPATAAALRAGTISAEHATVLAKHTTTTPARLSALTDAGAGEEFLVSAGASLDAADFVPPRV